MKKKIFTLTAAALLILTTVSCGKAKYIPDDYAVKPLQDQKIGYSSTIIDTPTKVFFLDGHLSYYSKADGKCYLFCSDPLCDHDNDDCPSNKFWQIWNDEYCNGRLYASVGDEIYSMKLDATDVRLVFKGGYVTEGKDTIYKIMHYKQYLYFLDLKSEEGFNLCRYDTVKEKTEDLSESAGFGVSSYLFGDDCIYFQKAYNSGVFRADLDLKNSKEIPGCNLGLYDGTYAYGTEVKVNGDDLIYIGLYRDNLEAGTHEVFYSEPSGLRVNVITVTDDAIYYTNTTRTEIGESNGYKVYNGSGGKLYRMDKNGENSRLIWDDLEYDVSEIYEIDGQFFATVTQYKLGSANVTEKIIMAKLIMNDSGEVVGVERMKGY